MFGLPGHSYLWDNHLGLGTVFIDANRRRSLISDNATLGTRGKSLPRCSFQTDSDDGPERVGDSLSCLSKIRPMFIKRCALAVKSPTIPSYLQSSSTLHSYLLTMSNDTAAVEGLLKKIRDTLLFQIQGPEQFSAAPLAISKMGTAFIAANPIRHLSLAETPDSEYDLESVIPVHSCPHNASSIDMFPDIPR